MSVCDILIVTYDAPDTLQPLVESIIRYTIPPDLFHIYIVNNGVPENMKPYEVNPQITILQQERNLGWEGGLKAGLAVSKAPFVLFMNDDTYVPSHQRFWLNEMLSEMVYPNCAAVGPTSNFVMGNQYMFMPLAESLYRAKFLIGFCMLVRRADLDAAGGVDDTLPGGDDLDLSIRLRKLGKYLLINREVFIFHHGAKTGTKVHGSDWNSLAMKERTDNALIMKHGLKEWLDLWGSEFTPCIPWTTQDTEGELCRLLAKGEKIVELGCGDKKTVEGAVGIDIVPKGQQIPGVAPGRYSSADLIGDVAEKLPVEDGSCDTIIARHILEHMTDTVGALSFWGRALKQGGRLIVAVPDQTIRNTIPMNPQHVHAFTPESLRRLMESLGWKTVSVQDAKNWVSFVGAFEKNGVHS